MQDWHQEGVTVDRKCDSPKKGVKGVSEVYQLTERCDSSEGGVRRCGECDTPKEVCHLTGIVTVIREV